MAKRTLLRYTRACRDFLQFCLDTVGSFPRSAGDTDTVLGRYFERLWQDGEPRGWAENARSALMHFLPALRRQLHGSQRLLMAWNKEELPERAPPFPARFVLAVAGAALARVSLRLSTLVLLGFHAFLRPGELLAVRAAHFVGEANANVIVLVLPCTKSGSRLQAVKESVLITDSLVVAYVRATIAHLEPGALLYPEGERRFREEFLFACKVAQLPAMGWMPRSLRRGGATSFFLASGCIDKTAVRGRWKSVKTARVYIDQAVAALASCVPSAAQSKAIDWWAAYAVHPEKRQQARMATR